ncbi:putative phosphonate metabolism protein [Ruegeria halocynthiae]|uniref:Putative phosphonate metabolism protein n=1 Tax=Ruegeria halocynthiae TaxID=985054 RepID=A0A1H2XXQ7_9RHOB|nr:DUF1045 domain-containing protein [Ruegeria halocynthiae]SDW97580.1 putative phosphonate metabolism protein [Ruegeria halocynthiae]
MSYSRFAIFYVPPEGSLERFGARWLGWDIVQGCKVDQPDLPELHDVTMAPRKYGFHGTLKPPFNLAEGLTFDDVKAAAAKLAAGLAPASCDGLCLTTLGRFLALTPRGDIDGLRRIAAACVRELDMFRAPPGEAELARRRNARLSPRQEALLTEWGYPYVMDEFRFHMTLTGRLPKNDIPAWIEVLQTHMPSLTEPFIIDQIALCGEREDGRFELLHRFTLTG